MVKISKRDFLLSATATLATTAKTTPAAFARNIEDIVTAEVDATRLDIFSLHVTEQYSKLADKFNLEELRKSVFLVFAMYEKTPVTTGTAILLSNDGYLAVCAHQIPDKLDTIVLGTVLPNEKPITLFAETCKVDRENDVAIIKITGPGFTSLIKSPDTAEFIKPIDRARPGHQKTKETAVILGYFDDKLHAVEIKFDDMVNEIDTNHT